MGRALVTKGEQLYDFICNRIKRVPTVNNKEYENFGLRTTKLLEFADGTIRFHAFARVIHFGLCVINREDLQSTTDRAEELRKLCLEMLEIGEHNCDDLNAFVNLALDAAQQARKSAIPRAEMKAVIDDYAGRAIPLRCYICDGELNRKATVYLPGVDLSFVQDPEVRAQLQKRIRRELNPRHLQYDHIWPVALGGDSIKDNLLPACHFCNRAKRHIVSWEWTLVQSAIWSPLEVSSKPLEKKVSKEIKIALHMRAALRFAERHEVSLKEAFLRLGPKKKSRVLSSKDTSDFFNLEVHDETKLESLWE